MIVVVVAAGVVVVVNQKNMHIYIDTQALCVYLSIYILYIYTHFYASPRIHTPLHQKLNLLRLRFWTVSALMSSTLGAELWDLFGLYTVLLYQAVIGLFSLKENTRKPSKSTVCYV